MYPNSVNPTPDSDRTDQIQSTGIGPSLANRIWSFYKRILVFPATSTGKERTVGLILYVFCLLIGIAAMITLLFESSRTYTETSKEHYPAHRSEFYSPDMIVCPKRTPESRKYKYNVKYNVDYIEELGMKVEHVDELTKMKLESCRGMSKCPELHDQCYGVFKPYCEKVNAALENRTYQNDSTRWCDIDNELLNDSQGRNYKWELETLWLKVVHPEMAPFKNCPRLTRQCHMYSNRDCLKNAVPVWFGESLCVHIPRQRLQDLDWSYIGLRRMNYDVDFWLGNIQTQVISRFYTTKTPASNASKIVGEGSIFAKYVYYSMFRVVRENGSKRICVHQPNLHGKTASCNEKSVGAISDYYELTIRGAESSLEEVSNQFAAVRSLKHTIRFKLASTSYTQFQLLAGLLSCFVGHSFMQVLYFLVEITKSRVFQRYNTLIKCLGLITLIVATVFMSYRDLSFYYVNQYHIVSSDGSTFNQYPTLDFSRHKSPSVILPQVGMLNITKIKEYNVSFEFLSYLRLVTYELDPTYNQGDYNTSISSKIGKFMYYAEDAAITMKGLRNLSTQFDVQDHLKVYKKIRLEARKLSIALGYSSEPSATGLAHEFLLDPNKIFVDCAVNGVSFVCGKYSHYYKRVGIGMILSWRLPKEAPEFRKDGSVMVGHENSYRLTLNMSEFLRHSRIQCQDSGWCDRYRHHFVGSGNISVFGNWHTEEAQLFIAFTSAQAMETNLMLEAQSDKRLKERAENNCFDEEDLICSNPPADATQVYLSIQMHDWCNCIDCSYQGKFAETIRSMLRSSGISDPIECCSVAVLTSCYTSVLLNAKRTGQFDDKSVLILQLLYRGVLLPDHMLSNGFPWHNANREMLAKVVRGFANFDPRIQEMLIEFTKNCFRPLCITHKLITVGTESYTRLADLVNNTAYCVSALAPGTEEKNRFNFIEFFGVLTCSYSISFGLGLIGICEIVFAVLTAFAKGYKSSSRLLDQHLLKTIGIWIKADKIDERLDHDPKTHSSSVKTVTVSPFEEAPNSERKDRMKSQSLGGNPDVPEVEASKTPACDNSKLEQKKKRPMHYESPLNGMIMVIMLVAATTLLVITITVYFSSLENYEIQEDVIVKPLIRPPSVHLCASNVSLAADLNKQLTKSSCKSQSSEFQSCDKFFGLFTQDEKDMYCFIHDTSSLPKIQLNASHTDFVLISPVDLPPLTLKLMDAGQLNSDSYKNKFECNGKNAKILYNVRTKRTENGIVHAGKPIEECKTNYILANQTCSLRGKLNDILLRDTYEALTFHLSVSLYKQEANDTIRRFFVIGPGSEISLTTILKPKYNFLVLLSIVGGFVGSFVELTVQNILSFFVLSIIYCIGKLK